MIWANFTAHQRSFGKVMFSQVSLCHSVNRGFPCDHYPWCIGPHCTWSPCPVPQHGTSLYRDPTSSRHGTSLYRNPSPSDILWPSLEICSNLFTSGPPGFTSADIWCLLKDIRSAQAGGTHHTGMLSCWLIVHRHHYCIPSFFRREITSKTEDDAGLPESIPGNKTHTSGKFI